jgi:hypothetical protein
LYVSYLEASHDDEKTAYLTIDGHRSDDFRARVLMTTNGGDKWRDITGDLPEDSPVRVVRENPLNADVLYCGNERAAYVSLDRGEHWLQLGGKSLPTVPVYDLVRQTRTGDLIAATHGRSLWILDAADCLAQLTDVADEALHLFPVPEATPRLYGFRGYGSGNRVYRGANPVDGAVLTYWLRDLPEDAPSIVIQDAAGRTVRTLSGSFRPGLNRVTWDLQEDPKSRFNDARRGGPVFVEPGQYTVKISAGEASTSLTFKVAPYAGWRPLETKAELPPR